MSFKVITNLTKEQAGLTLQSGVAAAVHAVTSATVSTQQAVAMASFADIGTEEQPLIVGAVALSGANAGRLMEILKKEFGLIDLQATRVAIVPDAPASDTPTIDRLPVELPNDGDRAPQADADADPSKPKTSEASA